MIRKSVITLEILAAVMSAAWAQHAAPGADNAFPSVADGYVYTAPVGSFPENGFGLLNLRGNVAEWVMECSSPTYDGAPADGAAWLAGTCDQRLTRGGA